MSLEVVTAVSGLTGVFSVMIFLQISLHVVILPTENTTGLQVWESKYYPYNVLERKMTDYLEVLFKRSPLIDVQVLDESGMNRWFASGHRPGDMALQMELFDAVFEERNILGKLEKGRVRVADRKSVV